jgi:hypothetical protein
MEEFFLFDQFDEHLCKMHDLDQDLFLRLTDEIMSEKDTYDFIYFSFNEEIEKAKEILDKYKLSYNEEGVIFSFANLDDNGIIIIGKGNTQYYIEAITNNIKSINTNDCLYYNSSFYIKNNLLIGITDFRFDNVLELFTYQFDNKNIEYYKLDRFIDTSTVYKPNLFLLTSDLLLIELTHKRITTILVFDINSKKIVHSFIINQLDLIIHISNSTTFSKPCYFNFYLENNNIHCLLYIETESSIIFSDVTINTLKINTIFKQEKESEAKSIYQIIRFQNKIIYKSNNKISVLNYLNCQFGFLNCFQAKNVNVFVFSHHRNSIILGTENNEIEIIEIGSSKKTLFETKTLPIKIIEKLGVISVYCKKGFIYSINNENIIDEKRVIFNQKNDVTLINKLIN